ncbi:MAG: hypothetical protein JF619_01050 [Massilia sp.]|nr:hypothetical protein [Massilia sp.]
MMQNAIVRVFDQIDQANAARDALLKEGFDGEAIALHAWSDEAGAMEGNFLVGDYTGRSEAEDPVYGRNFSPDRQRSPVRMTVEAGNPAMADFAAGLLERFGARDPDPASSS